MGAPTITDVVALHKKQLQQSLTQQQAVTESQVPPPQVDPSVSINDLFTNRPINTLPNFQQSMQRELEDAPFLTKFLGGPGALMDLAAYNVKRATGGKLTPEERTRYEAAPQVLGTTPGMLGGAALETLGTGPIYGALGKATAALGPASRFAANTTGSGALSAGLGAVTAPEGKAYENALNGLYYGAASSLPAQFSAGFLRPAIGSEAEQFAKRGIPLTPGQSAGGITRKMEDAQGMINPLVYARKGDAFDAWSESEINKALVRAGANPTVDLTKGNITAQGASRFNDAYANAYLGSKPLQLDEKLSTDLVDIYKQYGPVLSKSDAAALKEQIGRVDAEFHKPKPTFIPTTQQEADATAGLLDPLALKDLRGSYSNLATFAGKASQSGPANKRLADAYSAIDDALGAMLERQQPGVAAKVKKVDSGYSDFLRLQAAAGKTGAESGTFTPDKVLQSMRELDESANKRSFARNTTRPELRASVEQAKRVLGANNAEPVGQAGMQRMLMNALLYGGLGYGTGYLAGANNPLMMGLATLGLGGAAWTRPGNKFLVGAGSLQPQSMPGSIPALGTSLFTSPGGQ